MIDSTVAGLMTVIVPSWCSPVAGAARPRESVPLPSAVHARLAVWLELVLMVQVKSWLADAARVATLAGLKEAQSPPASTWTLVRGPSPVFVSVTTIVTESPAWILVAETLLSVSEVDGLTTSTLPCWCSPVAGTAWPSASVPLPSAVQLKSLAGAENAHVKSTASLGASEPLKAPPPTFVDEATQFAAHGPVPSTWTLVIVPSPVLASRMTIVTESPSWT